MAKKHSDNRENSSANGRCASKGRGQPSMLGWSPMEFVDEIRTGQNRDMRQFVLQD